ncbi:hypothetical protein EDM56_02185 [Brevibacillus fluminis]|uniref:Uncharacterized protein n=1 Tax=Brevibacillus fluminis TaxID=511487 RepID=A0A3M8DYB3_9BACL|nr:hypothetical protein [Brevibacillus fluminis]RNB92525.1 hypothetical protein EDM56_02185 [Brevibacillus fluminis]
MLFQMCYGPEIQTIFESIRRNPGLSRCQLKHTYQYQEEGDISSLIDGALVILKDLNYIHDENGFLYSNDVDWKVTDIFRKLNRISQTEEEETLNFVFSTMYDQVFVKPDKMFVVNIHYQVNSKFSKTMVGHEKINAWKRIMEFLGLGRRVYSGFYALPQLSLLQEIVREAGEYEGGLQPYCERVIQPILPCITSQGNIFKGILYGLLALNDQRIIEISCKQDLPYKSYGPNHEWNWIKVQ